MPKEITTLDSVRARSLKDTSFTETEVKGKKRLVLAIDGETGSGKNELLFTFPDPIAFMSFDPNYKTAYEKARKRGVRILRAEYKMPIVKPDAKNSDYISKVFGETWDKWANDFMGAVRDPKVETIGIDTATELFELVTYAIYGKNVQIMPKERGLAYATYRQIIWEAKSTTKNLVLLHKMKDEWKNDKTTGKRIRAGYKDTDFNTDTELLMTKNSEEPYPDRYHCQILKCHLNPQIEYDGNGNGELTGDMITFENLSLMVWG